METDEKSRPCAFCTARVMVTLAVVATVIIGSVTVFLINSHNSTDPVPGPSFPTNGDLLDYLMDSGNIQEKDGLLVSWYHAANKKMELQKALNSTALVLEADVNVEGYNTAQETDIPIMAHPPDVYSDNTLQEWLDAVLNTRKGIKLDFKSTESIDPSLDVLLKKSLKVNIGRPVWLNADILHGPNVPQFVDVVNATKFINAIQVKFPDVTISPGWKTLYLPFLPNSVYTRGMMEKMYEIIKELPQQVTFPLQAVMVKQAWPHVSWLLKQSPRYSLTLWQGNTDPVTVDDLLFIRDNSQPDQIYYDIYEPVLSMFKEVALKKTRTRRFYTGGNLIDYFGPQSSDGFYIEWFHINNKESLESIMKGEDGGMIILQVGSMKNHKERIAVEGSETQFLLEECLEMIQFSSKKWGIFLKIKSQKVLNLTLPLLKHIYENNMLFRPIWINMDISHGRFATLGYTEGETFVNIINSIFPFVTIAPGWPNEVLKNGYTKQLVEDMLSLFKNVWQDVSFQLEAVPLGKTWPEATRLLQSSNRFSITVEHQHEQGGYYAGFKGLLLSRDENKSRVFYNLPEDYRRSFSRDIFTS
ncbi:protein FAM151A isoform X1 [Erpetoichthys calabaricus]|uniref:Protein FAM151A n=2 Tax=Erpetoichthys calabaricus TaxID=27687 RepID=A0A8C4S4R3_ERPCA|nr:protein FAM151A isoform X1 [Erpetoichthys calabaricus]